MDIAESVKENCMQQIPLYWLQSKYERKDMILWLLEYVQTDWVFAHMAVARYQHQNDSENALI